MPRYLAILILTVAVTGQTPSKTPLPPSTLGLGSGLVSFETAQFSIKLVNASQTLAALEPRSSTGFDFTPADRIQDRGSDGYFHFGDINFRVRVGNAEWRLFSTASVRKPVIQMPMQAPDLAKADLAPSLPADCPIEVIRRWTVRNGKLVLLFDLSNKTGDAIEIGYLGIPLVFNNIITDRTLAEAHEKNSFSDPYIGLDAGSLALRSLHL